MELLDTEDIGDSYFKYKWATPEHELHYTNRGIPELHIIVAWAEKKWL